MRGLGGPAGRCPEETGLWPGDGRGTKARPRSGDGLCLCGLRQAAGRHRQEAHEELAPRPTSTRGSQSAGIRASSATSAQVAELLLSGWAQRPVPHQPSGVWR